MAGNWRHAEAQVWLGRGAAVLSIVVGFGGCRDPDPDTLTVAERASLPEAAASLHLVADGSFWIGRIGELIHTDGSGEVRARLSIAEAGVPHAIAALQERIYFRVGPAVLVLDTAADSVLVQRNDLPGEAVAVDARERFVFRSGAAGAVLAHDAASLDPVWGWGAVGAPATALAVSPEGDRVYEAIGDDDGEVAELLVRDLQTGRILRRVDLPAPARALLAAPDGSLYGASWSADDGGSVFRLRWEDGSLETSWRRTFGKLAANGTARLRLSHGADRLAVLSVQNEDGLHVLDVETGRTVDRLRGVAFDVAFDASDRIYLLVGSELRRLE